MRWDGRLRCLVTAALVLALGTGCGLIADKTRIKIAKIGDESITRGDLADWIRNLPDEERPTIRTLEDLNAALNDLILSRIKLDQLDQLQAVGLIYGHLDQASDEPGAIFVPREAGAQLYYQKHPELKVRVEDPSAIGLDAAQYKNLLDSVEYGIDREHRLLMAEKALELVTVRANHQGALRINEAELKVSYEAEKENLQKLEQMLFDAVCFPTTDESAVREAANTRKALDEGVAFDDVAAMHYNVDPLENSYVRLGIANNPDLDKFKGFWQEAKGAQVGDYVGPVFLPASQFVVQGPDGEMVVRYFPDAYIVFQVLEYEPARTLTFEEAAEKLLYPSLREKMIERLYGEYGVELYEDNLPDPAVYGADVAST